MNVSICIPYRPSGPHRTAAFKHVRRFWRRNFDWPVWTSDTPGSFNRSEARNDAARAAGDWDIVLFADADTFGNPDLIRWAVRTAAETGRISYPFNRYAGLSAQGTRRLYNTGEIGQIRKRKPNSPGGIFAVPRELYITVGGFDPGFEGWGYEDMAFYRAATTLGGAARRHPGTIIHLWHPMASEKRDAIAGKTPNKARAVRYRDAQGKPDKMRQLITDLELSWP